jgi:hypothetical protein
MMLGLEYLIRHRIVEDMTDYPLSLFLLGAERIVVAIDRKGATKLLVRKFHIDQAVIKEPLPPCEEFTIKASAVFSDARIVIPGFRPMSYHEEPVESELNAPRRPIEADYYNYLTKNLLNSGFHRACKENWLWAAFYKTYILPFEQRIVKEEDSIDEHFHQLNAKDCARKDRHLWAHWLLWKRIVMPDSMMRRPNQNIAGELAFTPAYLDLNSVRVD